MEQKNTQDIDTADIVVRASTEAVDSTGKTIYEGDIVEYTGFQGRRNRSTIEYFPNLAAFGFFMRDYGYIAHLTKKELSTLKVVGHKDETDKQ